MWFIITNKFLNHLLSPFRLKYYNTIHYKFNYKFILILLIPISSTTIDKIEVKLNNLSLIDTPGLLDSGDIINYIENVEKNI